MNLDKNMKPLALSLVAATLALAPLGHAIAQSWPTKPVTVVVPFPPGGGPDFFARLLAERLPQRLGQPLVVENRPGVGGLAGASFVARSSPDGHTLLIAPNTIAIAPHIVAKGAGGGIAQHLRAGKLQV
ncbi:MAG: tripartite tricarboxylate transporter substrate-binding protein, partial [Burkholderiales bacterium]